MKSSLANIVRLFLAALVLSLQLAGSSPVLHDFLHGPDVEQQASCDHEGSGCGSGDSDAEDCDNSCAVGMLSDGIWVAPALELAAVNPSVSISARPAAPDRVLSKIKRIEAARAPPVS